MIRFFGKINKGSVLLSVSALLLATLLLAALKTDDTYAYMSATVQAKTEEIETASWSVDSVRLVVGTPLQTDGGDAESPVTYELDPEDMHFTAEVGKFYTLFVTTSGNSNAGYITVCFEDIPVYYATLPESGTSSVTIPSIMGEAGSSFTVYVNAVWGGELPTELIRIKTYKVLDFSELMALELLELPKEAEEPAETTVPEATSSPEETSAPEATAEPETGEEPGASEETDPLTPIVSPTPEATPEPTATPNPLEPVTTPEPTPESTPEPVTTPEPTPEPTAETTPEPEPLASAEQAQE